MASANPPLTLIVAATIKNGIGKNGALPWPMLKKEMAYFARVTKRVPQQLSTASSQPQNVVIMGRKTWDSIPPKLRPLKGRTNIVITRQAPEQLAIGTQDVIVAGSIQQGLQELEERAQKGTARPAARSFVIGGSSIYDAALQLPNCDSILLTRIQKEYECDTHFPIALSEQTETETRWTKRSNTELSDFVEEPIEDQDMEDVVDGESVKYRLYLYTRDSQ